MDRLVKKNNWNPYLPLSTLPKKIRKYFMEHAKILYEELRYNKLEVILVPAPEPYTERNKIRVVENRPPVWYSEMYYQLNKSRKLTLKALERIIKEIDKETKNKKYSGKYKTDAKIRGLIFEHLILGYEENGYFSIDPIKEVISYFKV